MIHIADPDAFWSAGQTQRAVGGLRAHPDWLSPAHRSRRFLAIVNGLAAVIARHPATTFIAAHVSSYAENLGGVAT